MINQKHIMVDIETMDVGPTSDVVSIGARMFTFKDGPGKGFEVFIDQDEAVKLGTVGIDTMNWWRKQVGFDQAFSGKTQPEAAAHGLAQFIKEHKPACVWANSPHFDLVILRHLFKQVSLPFPFHYRDERDVRTMCALARALDIDISSAWKGKCKHQALDDATAQAQAVVLVVQTLNSPGVPSPLASVGRPADLVQCELAPAKSTESSET
jgi:exodeoxyribonuclease VIII